ncbi:MAG: type I glyceraldehyde-3-phosphate dehydrogenase [Helicobacter sp.]|nr:type I glyceraldehyde-3-phosphate dehydrogenase [Helicobacter sp.]
MAKIKVAINGFGRIGRCAARVILEREDLELVAINDPGSWEALRYLFEHDSVFRNHKSKVSFENGFLKVGDHQIRTFGTRNIDEVDFGDADVVLECSGKFLTVEALTPYIKKGAKRVILSAPSKDDMPMFVLGVNDKNYNGQTIISNGSCTTNCIAPVCHLLHENFGVINGNMLTVHSYTNDQNLVDSPHPKEIRRSRASAINMIPTTTGAAKNLYRVIPHLKGNFHGHSVRVPTPVVSMIDVNLNLEKQATKEQINEVFEKAANGALKGILSVDNDNCVSSDFIQNSHSCIVASDLTFCVGNLAKVMAWYDNEWGYSTRLVDIIKLTL